MVPACVYRRFVTLVAVVAALLAGIGICRGEEAGLSGRVVDAGGTRLAEVNVSLYLDDTEAAQRHYRKLRDVTTAADGAYEFADLPAGWYLVVAERQGLARSFWYAVLEEGVHLANDLTLRRPVSSTILVRDDKGKPVTGATLRTLEFRDDTGEFFVRRRDEWELFEMVVSPSDEDGRLRLPELPEGSVFTVTVDHDDLAPAEVKDGKAGSEVMTEIVMKPGTTVALKIAGDEDGGTISEAEIDCRHDPFSHPSSIFWRHVPVDDEGTARVTVEAGRYRLLRLTHHDYYILPEYSPNISNGEFLRIGDSAHEEFYFQMFPKVKVRGRVVDPTGKPLAKLRVLGELPNGDFDQLPSTISAEEMPDDWAYVDFVETNEQGEYTLELAAGPARVHAEGQGYLTDQEHIDVHVAADGSTIVPDIVVRPMPDVTGTVVDQSGQPVEGAIVRLRGELRFMQPTKTDEHGKFQLSPWWIPVDFNTKESKPEQPLYAFHPYERLGVHTTIRLNNSDSLKDLTLMLSPQEPQAFLDGYREESTPAERGEVNQERLAEHGAESLIGQPAPPLDGTWLNIDEPAEGLAAFRGKYVLLDFWFIGCGPCHADYPSVQLLHDLYKDQGVVVIAVHNNSSTADAVRQFAEKEGMTVPILVDEQAGTTIARYEGRGLAGYPSHILIGPDGTVIDDDRTTPGPSLRTYKIELIRELLLE